LGLASLGEAKEKPQLLVSGDEKEVFYVFVGENGLVIFSATYPLIDIVKSTEEVVKYLAEKYPEHPVRKTLVYGTNAAESGKALKQNGLVVEELSLKAKQYPLMELIKEFSDAKLIFMPPHLEKQDGSTPKIGGLKSLFGSKKGKSEEMPSEAAVEPVLAEMANGAITRAELKASKENLIGSFAQRMDSNRERVGLISMIGMYGLPLDYLVSWTSRVDAVTLEQVAKQAERFLKPESWSRVRVGAKLQ